MGYKMKIINNQGKLFGLINIVDLLILLFLVAIGIVVLTKVSNISQPIAKVNEVIAKVNDVSAEVKSGIAVSDLLYNRKYSDSGAVGEIIEIISSRPAEKVLVTQDGQQIISKSPTNYDIHVKIRFKQPVLIYETKMNYHNKPIDIRIGALIEFYNNKYTLHFQIVKQTLAQIEN